MTRATMEMPGNITDLKQTRYRETPQRGGKVKEAKSPQCLSQNDITAPTRMGKDPSSTDSQ